MPAGLNKVMLIGNLGTDPELRYTANGSAVTSFRMAVSRSINSDGNKREETEWVSVVTWNKLAELLSQNLVKGRRVYVEGRMQTRSWDGPDGQKRQRTEVVGQQVLFLDSRQNGGQPSDDLPDLDDDLPFE